MLYCANTVTLFSAQAHMKSYIRVTEKPFRHPLQSSFTLYKGATK